jgi:hypothetical protein
MRQETKAKGPGAGVVEIAELVNNQDGAPTRHVWRGKPGKAPVRA